MYVIDSYGGILEVIHLAYGELAAWLKIRGQRMKFPLSAYEDQFALAYLPSSVDAPSMANGPNGGHQTIRWNSAERVLVAEEFAFQSLKHPFDSFLKVINLAQEVLPTARQHKVKNTQSLGSDMRLLIGIACSNLLKLIELVRAQMPNPHWSVAHEPSHLELNQTGADLNDATGVRIMPGAEFLHFFVRRVRDEMAGQGLNPTKLMKLLIEAMEADEPKTPPLRESEYLVPGAQAVAGA
jgi:hypothetical protein